MNAVSLALSNLKVKPSQFVGDSFVYCDCKASIHQEIMGSAQSAQLTETT
jgi:hypothetical protein